VVFVEDEALLRGLLVEFFHRSGLFEVVGAYGDGTEAIAQIGRLRPDIVVLDLQLPGMHGRSVVEAVNRFSKPPKVLVLSSSTNPLLVRELLKMGVNGILQKGISAGNVLSAAERVLSGGICLELPEGDLRDLALAPFSAENASLTSREVEILDLVARGQRSKEIASLLGLSVRTVDKHRENLMRKLGVNDMGGLIRYAAQNGLIPHASVKSEVSTH
jgi:DNA-binding NarL/FixJ family response regulator